MQRDAICPAVWAILAVLLLSTPLAAQPAVPQGTVSPTDLAQIKSPVDLQRLIEKQVAAGNLDEAKKSLEDARIRFSTRAFLPVLGPCYELVGMKTKALKFHTQFNQLFPGNLLAMSNLAKFYVKNGDPRSGVALARKMLKVKIDASASLQNEKLMSWARRRVAEALGSSGEVAKINEALAMIAENGGAELTGEDVLIGARLLSTMPDAANRDKAIQILTQEIDKQSPDLTRNDYVRLASLWERSGNWAKARETIQKRLDVKPETPGPAATQERMFFASYMIDMLILNDHPSDTGDYLKIIEKQSSDPAQLLPMRAVTWAKQGKTAKATRLLTDAARDAWPPNTPEKLATIKNISLLFMRIERFKEAEAMLRAYVKISPQDELTLAVFLGLHGDLDEALEICQKVIEKRPSDRANAVQAAVTFLGSRRNESTEKQIDRVALWAAPLLGGGAGVSMKLQLANLRGDYEAVALAYREILRERPGLKGSGTSTEASILNDLGFVLGHRLGRGNKARYDEALAYSNQAIDILGERSELLDTRAMIYLAAPVSDDKIGLAIADMTKALADHLPGRQASLHFHMAMIQKLAGNSQPAIEQLRLAIKDGLKIGQLSKREAKVFNELSGRLPSRGK